jgi:hypothetical protein
VLVLATWNPFLDLTLEFVVCCNVAWAALANSIAGGVMSQSTLDVASKTCVNKKSWGSPLNKKRDIAGFVVDGAARVPLGRSKRGRSKARKNSSKCKLFLLLLISGGKAFWSIATSWSC